MSGFDYDLCIIGGGVNGAGIARDAAGRGLSVLLLEAKDLACATSSASTKLIHGGLRYLEFLEFRLVRDSLRERETLLGIAPHIIKPMEFVLPYDPGRRPYWMIRAGLFLYDHLAPRKSLKGSYGLNLQHEPRGRPLIGTYEKGFCYSDCWVDDSRLVALNAMDAAARGAKILTYHACTGVEPADDGWRVSYQNELSGRSAHVKVSMVVNAAGPWVSDVVNLSGLVAPGVPKIRLVKGSHIIINRAFEGSQAYILQQPDKRIVFAIPYEHDYTLIGTTEEAFEGDVYDPRISDDELDYLCSAFSTHFKKDITREDVLWTYSGVRPLFDEGAGSDARTATRDYVLHMHGGTKAPFLSVYGGKLTTYRILSEQAVNRLLHLDNRYAPSWTQDAPLPGGDFPAADFDAFLDSKMEDYPWLPNDLIMRYARSYGTRMDRFLSGASSLNDLGRDFGAGLYEAEVSYLIKFEFARKAEDVLWRRSKLGMHMSDPEIADLEAAFDKLVKGA